ncbi:alpha/beta hydrolase [Pelagibius litoralis]|uniref:Alpha/beta hydrolase n=1 Tax=Pelagibius litoralis TaxID=374515 RepID=A0A967C3H8_9PROT|nr:alpha/beta hydrolase [Pelagibius litoralis]
MSFPRTGNDLLQPVLALHCSGADGRQWRPLAENLEPPLHLLTPAFYGAAGNAGWSGDHAFSLADEAGPILELIDATAVPFHMIGHSYGGGVALHIALQRPHAVSSLTLYEPSAFHLLRMAEPEEAGSFAEISAVAEATVRGLANGDYRSAAGHFVDYWGGDGAWAALRPSLQTALTQWLPKAPLDFRALIEEPTCLEAYRRLDFPVLILRGAFAPAPTAAVARLLAGALPNCEVKTIAGAGHMGPISHAETVNRHILNFLNANQKSGAVFRRALCRPTQ